MPFFFYQRCFKKIFSKKVNSAYLMKRRKNNGNWLTESPIVPWVSGVIDCFLWCWSWGVLVFQCEKVLINAKREVCSSAYVRWEIDLWCQSNSLPEVERLPTLMEHQNAAEQWSELLLGCSEMGALHHCQLQSCRNDFFFLRLLPTKHVM